MEFSFCANCEKELVWQYAEGHDKPSSIGYWTTRPDSNDLIHLTCGDGQIHQRQTISMSFMQAHLEMIEEDLR